MRLIKDPNGLDLITMALMIDWRLSTTCYVEGCEERANCICVHDAGTFTLCEKHYQEANVPGGAHLTIVFPAQAEAITEEIANEG